jgi:thioredoxin-like negative regulator of GroEL
VGDGLGGVSVVALPAVVAVAAGGEVAAFEAHAARLAARQFVQLHVEAAAAGVIVAVAR